MLAPGYRISYSPAQAIIHSPAEQRMKDRIGCPVRAAVLDDDKAQGGYFRIIVLLEEIGIDGVCSLAIH